VLSTVLKDSRESNRVHIIQGLGTPKEVTQDLKICEEMETRNMSKNKVKEWESSLPRTYLYSSITEQKKYFQITYVLILFQVLYKLMSILFFMLANLLHVALKCDHDLSSTEFHPSYIWYYFEIHFLEKE
jgi:hypothetical protein